MNKQKLTIIALAIIVVILIGCLFYFLILPRYNQGIYNLGYESGALITSTTGNIYYTQNVSGKIVLNQTTITNVCQNLIKQNYKQICNITG